METQHPADLAKIASEMQLRVEQVQVAVGLLHQDNTIPFITRYRRDETGGLDEPQLRRIQQRLAQLTSLRERKLSILKSIQSQTEIDPALKQRIENCFSPKLLEDLYLPFKPRKTSWTQQARELGLMPLAEAVLAEGLTADDFENELKLATDPEGNPLERELVLRGVRSLIGEAFSEDIELRNRLRRAAWKASHLTSQRLPPPSGESAAPVGDRSAASVTLQEPRNTADPETQRDENPSPTDPAETPPIASTSDETPTTTQPVTTEATVADSAPTAQPPSDSSVKSTAGTTTGLEGGSTVAAPLPQASAAPPTRRKRKRKKKRRDDERFKDFFDFSEPIRSIPPHRILAVNRGEKEKKLRVRVQLPEDKLWEIFCKHLIPPHHAQFDLLKEAARETLSRSLMPALEREIRRELTEKAEEHAIEVFTTNLRSLLLQPPIPGFRVLALDPGFKTGCKAAVLDELGNFVESTVISIVGNRQKRDASQQKLAGLIRQHDVNLIAIGNGTGCRETELLVSRLISGELADQQLKYVIVNEAGASIYSTSEIGREEFPEVDPTIRSAISIGRRLLDPLSELVKIDPAHIGVGLYQHDVKSRHLADSLDAVVESCVNHVGVDANTASPALLSYVAGLNQSTARKICEYRRENGPFASRETLKKVPGIGNSTFIQCAGFLRIHGGDQPLDSTAIHPESYPVVRNVLQHLECSEADLATQVCDRKSEPRETSSLTDRLKQVEAEQLAQELSIGVFRMKDILDVMGRPRRDPRESVPPPVFRSGVLDIEDLNVGMHLRGQVLNVVDFGIFVDIGLGESGLVHISNLSTGYIKDPHQYYSVGDVLDVWVDSIDKKLKRVSLTAIDPEKTATNATSRREANSRSPGTQRRGGPRGRKSGADSAAKGKSQARRRGGKKPASRKPASKRPVKPLTEEMASGQEPMRSFSDLMQYVAIQNDHGKPNPPGNSG